MARIITASTRCKRCHAAIVKAWAALNNSICGVCLLKSRRMGEDPTKKSKY
jgi:formylmethanofuran dehydrogenase subunit E